MRHLILLILFARVLSPALAQEKNRVLTYLSDTTGRQNTYLHVQFGCNVPVMSNFSSMGTGMQFSFGPNLAFLVSRKWTAGIYVGIKWSEFFTMGKFNPEFSEDLNSSLQPGNGYAHDSVLTSYFAQQTGVRSQHGGATFMQVGLFVSYPKRYLPLVKVYRAFTGESIEAYRYDGVSTNDYIYFTSGKNYGISASWTVWKFKNSLRLNVAGWFMHSRIQSFNLEGLWLHEFVHPDFVSKYQHVWRGGITIGMEFY